MIDVRMRKDHQEVPLSKSGHLASKAMEGTFAAFGTKARRVRTWIGTMEDKAVKEDIVITDTRAAVYRFVD